MPVGDGSLTVNPYMMEEGEAELVAKRLGEIFARSTERPVRSVGYTE